MGLSAKLALFAIVLASCRPSPSRRQPPPAEAPARTPAETMSWLASDWLTRPERVDEEQPDRMLDALAIEPGMAVADVGAGVGYHTLKLSPRVGPTGHVYATDIQREMLAKIDGAVAARGLHNVTTVLASDEWTGLAPGSIDLALMVDVYHEIRAPERFLGLLAKALKPKGRVVLVEFRGEDPSVPIKEEHKMTAAQVVRELGAAGFTMTDRQEFLPWQHILVFRRSGDPG